MGNDYNVLQEKEFRYNKMEEVYKNKNTLINYVFFY